MPLGMERRIGLAALLSTGLLPLAGCASAPLEHSLTDIGAPVEADGFEAARLSPLDARAHYATALALMGRQGRTRADLEMARAGFRTASRLSPDLWEPLAGLAAVEYRLGNHREAMEAMAQAAARRGDGSELMASFALLAFRAQEPELARLAASRGAHDAFLDAALQDGTWHPVPRENPLPPDMTEIAPAQVVRAVTPDPELAKPAAQGAARPEFAMFGSKTASFSSAPSSPDPSPSPSPSPAASANVVLDGRAVVIEAFMVRDTRQSSRSDGLNLLDSLSVQFGGTLLNYSYDSQAAADTRTGNFTVTAPSVAYSLNLAARDRSQVTLEASPLVLARVGKTSKFLEGGSVLIVPLADNGDPVERNVGITLEVTPEYIGDRSADLNVVLELSNITGQSLSEAGRGASLLQTDKTRVEVSARVPFGKAIVVGSAGSMARRETGNNSLSAKDVPGLSRKNATASTRNVLVLLSVRSPDDRAMPMTASAIARLLFAADLPSDRSYARRPSDVPDPGIERLLPRTLY